MLPSVKIMAMVIAMALAKAMLIVMVMVRDKVDDDDVYCKWDELRADAGESWVHKRSATNCIAPVAAQFQPYIEFSRKNCKNPDNNMNYSKRKSDMDFL